MNLEVLYEPLPVGRVGVKKDTQEIVIARDFSCFALMLEEHISFGAVNICIPSSSPELKAFEDMPRILRERIRVLDDKEEDEVTRRILYELRKEFKVGILEDELHLEKNKEMPISLFKDIDFVHQCFKKLALGFNHNVQVDINVDYAAVVVRRLRGKCTDRQTRIILAQLESIFRSYERIEFKAPALISGNAPKELINIFNKLINDSTYLEYSDSIANLSKPSSRAKALNRVREISEGIKSSEIVKNGWNITSKIITACSGVPVPDTTILSSFSSERQLPQLTDLSVARSDVVNTWKESTLSKVPLKRDGQPIADDSVFWLPPLKSMEVYSPNNESISSFGTVNELLNCLQEYTEDMKTKEV